jgi:hypothetical protein
MDSYLIEDEGKKYIYISSLEMPIQLTNKTLKIRSLEIQKDMVLGPPIDLAVSGYHVRSVFQSQPPDKTVYIVDHGLDIVPYPGGSVQKMNLKSHEINSYNNMAGKFNFSGDAYIFKGVRYEVFVGFNFVHLYQDGKEVDLKNILGPLAEPVGFLTAVFFEKENELNLFLGVTDTYPHHCAEVDRYDVLLNLSTIEPSFTRIERCVPWNWATVYASVQESVPGIGRILKVCYHNPGFNEPRIGYYLIDQGFKFKEIKIEKIPEIKNNWIPNFAFRLDTPHEIVVMLRAGSLGGKFGVFSINTESSSLIRFNEMGLTGLHVIDGVIYGLNWELKLVKL